MARKRPPPATAPNLTIEEALARAYAHWNAGQADQAELFCQRVLAVWPGQADALHLMGVMTHAYGNRDLALQHVRQACLAPRAPAQYFSNLAEMCRQKGLLDEGERAGRRAVTLDANLVAGWNNLGIILQEAGKLDESVACLERVIRLKPDWPEAHNNVGNTYKRLRRLDRAEAHYRKAIEIFPDYAEAHSNLANLLNDLGQPNDAEAEVRIAIELNPRLADAYINLAAIELDRHRYHAALHWLDVLLAFAPRHVGGLSARAMALMHLDRLTEAEDCARLAIATDPGNAEAHNALGRCLQAVGRVDLALDSFQQAATLPGTVAEAAQVSRAALLIEIGRPQEALATLDAVIAANPLSAASWFSRANLKTFTAGDPEITTMEALLQERLLSFHDRMSLHFALGKAYLDAGDDDRTFHHLHQGNRMKRSTLSFDAEATEAWMRRIADSFMPTRFAALDGVGCPSDLPVFIIGIPRSGTSLVEQILASHPAVHGAGELSTLQRLIQAFGDYPQSLDRLTGTALTGLGEAYVARVAPLARERRHVVDKMPANFLYAGVIRLCLPNARIIHCRRNPVDTCLSCYTKLFSAEHPFAYDLAELGRFYRCYQDLMAHWRTVLPPNRFLEVEYEAVVDDLDGQARRLIDFLGLPWDSACTRFHENPRIVRTASVNQVRQPIYQSAAGRWKRHVHHLGPLLDALGIGAG